MQLQQREKFYSELGFTRYLSLPCSSGGGKDLKGRKLGSNLGNTGSLYVREGESHLISSRCSINI